MGLNFPARPVLLILALASVAIVAGQEWKRAGERFNLAGDMPLTGAPASPGPARAGKAVRSLPAPAAVQRVLDLESKLAQAESALESAGKAKDAADARLNGQGDESAGSASPGSSDRIATSAAYSQGTPSEQAIRDLEILASRRQALAARILKPAELLQLERERIAAENDLGALVERLKREEVAHREWDRKLKEAQAMNMDTDLLRSIQPKAQAQAAALATTRRQLDQARLDLALRESELKRIKDLSHADEDRLASLDERISEQQAQLSRLRQSERSAQAERQRAGEVARESAANRAHDRYWELKRTRDQAQADLTAARKAVSIPLQGEATRIN